MIRSDILKTPAPLYEDPVWGGPSDPKVIWNPLEKQWWMIYTQRHAWGYPLGSSSVHGTDIGVASSPDAAAWTYRGTLKGLQIGHGRDTYWAPDVIFEPEKALWHMFVSYIEGVPSTWSGNASIMHFTSDNLWEWQFAGRIPTSSDRVIDACVCRISEDHFKMWYKDERRSSHTVAATSTDLYQWSECGEEITDCPHEGPEVFRLGGRIWMITDTWDGLGVYESEDYAHWLRQKGNLLKKPGSRPMDCEIGNHASVYINGDSGYLFYFVHPDFPSALRSNTAMNLTFREHHTVIQAARLSVQGGRLCCDRDQDFDIREMMPIGEQATSDKESITETSDGRGKLYGTHNKD